MAGPASVTSELSVEFERQVENLVAKGYPQMLGWSEQHLRTVLAPLAEQVEDARSPGAGVPFVVVVRGIPVERAIELVELRGKQGFTDMEADDLARFSPIDGVEVPGGDAYLATGLDTGPGSLDVTPDDALPVILERGRSPLTLEEGIALVTHHPDLLRSANSFSVLGSRCGDRRVPAVWVSKGRPRLGWCWAGNPHTWLGSASCAGRVGLT